jgi:hypothetical protein
VSETLSIRQQTSHFPEQVFADVGIKGCLKLWNHFLKFTFHLGEITPGHREQVPTAFRLMPYRVHGMTALIATGEALEKTKQSPASFSKLWPSRMVRTHTQDPAAADSSPASVRWYPAPALALACWWQQPAATCNGRESRLELELESGRGLMTTVVAVIFGVFAIGLIVLLIYKSTLTMHRDDQLFLDDASSHMHEEQTELLAKVTRLTIPVRVFSTGSGIFFLVLVAMLIYQKLNAVQ